MADPELRLPENVPGDFFVDSTCIDCDACRIFAPEVFSDARDQSFVSRQPRAKFRARFGCERVLHFDDARGRVFERMPRGGQPVDLGDDIVMIPTPGHTRGHAVFLYRDKYLFTGDHLAWSPTRGHLYAFRSACWYSWPEQIRSMERLLDYSFEWVLPGHGRPVRLSRGAMRESLERCIAWMKERS